MGLKQVIKTELYKNTHRKSSLILLIPMILAVLISFGYAKGFIKLNLTVGAGGKYSCMDFVFIIWNVLSGLGIMGILLILFAAFQFSGEIEHGQIKMELLRIGKRHTVVAGKYVAVMIVAAVAIAGTIFACMVSYYLFVSNSPLGAGTFASTTDGLSTWEIIASMMLQAVIYFVLTAICFLIGIKTGPFATFILTMVIMYAVNYLAGADNVIARLMPSYWSNQLMMKGDVPWMQTALSVVILLLFSAVQICFMSYSFSKKDIK
ncbi:MAG: hypothetical protein MSA90_21535 [Faecalicatena sp.]|uniref:hypothetical protein n=1 Tax=Faecalicatena sp. TaxID=2005360 RepID=UPI002586244C|nr:hypothetical protein [Faecalicatena sp.]MCI6468033.1 hypothetical protein [Faecalicatena sp.]MDY5618510.1 hypothetical protein [Lachnospiraceae bacterium]